MALTGIILLSRSENTVNDHHSKKSIYNNTYIRSNVRNQEKKIMMEEPHYEENTILNDQASPVIEHLSYNELRLSIFEYFDNYQDYSNIERIAFTNKIESKLSILESSEAIIPLEALSLKLALLKTTTRESEYPALAEELTKEYEESISAVAPEIDHEKNANYKQREREVLLEVQAMSQYPDGMSQSEYLRHRLQLLRTEVFEGSD